MKELKKQGDANKEYWREKIRCTLINHFKMLVDLSKTWNGLKNTDILAWLEKQRESNPYSGTSFEYNGHTWGMCARDNGVEIIFDGKLKAFLSSEKSFIHPQLDLTSKSALEEAKEEKVDNQNCVKPADKIEPKFKVGDKIQYLKGCGTIMTIEKIENGEYIFANNLGHTTIENGNKWYLVERNPTWSKEDEYYYGVIQYILNNECVGKTDKENAIKWFKSLKDKIQPQPKQEWKQENTSDLTDFENAMMHIGSSFFGENAGLDPNDTNAIKEQANILLELVQKQGKQKTVWSEEDENAMWLLKDIVRHSNEINENIYTMPLKEKLYDWLKSIKDRVQPKQEWNEEDEDILNTIINYFEIDLECTENDDIIKWLKSLKPQNKWKPSDEQISVIEAVINNRSFQKRNLDSLYEQLKKLKEE